MKNDKYWAKRTAATQEKLTTKSIKDTEKQLQKYYRKTLEKTLDRFENVYLKIFHNITEGTEVTPADLYKLDSYWKLQEQLRQELQHLGDKEVEILTQSFINHYELIYKGLAIDGESYFNTLDKGAVNQMINQIWCADGKSWSERVWKNTDLLQQELNDKLIECVAVGRKTSQLKDALIERFNVSYHRADSIVRTELAHIQTQAAQNRYRDYGIQEVEILAEEDSRRCDICARYDKKRYPINAQMPIPFHPNCRCCIIPVVED